MGDVHAQCQHNSSKPQCDSYAWWLAAELSWSCFLVALDVYASPHRRLSIHITFWNPGYELEWVFLLIIWAWTAYGLHVMWSCDQQHLIEGASTLCIAVWRAGLFVTTTRGVCAKMVNVLIRKVFDMIQTRSRVIFWLLWDLTCCSQRSGSLTDD